MAADASRAAWAALRPAQQHPGLLALLHRSERIVWFHGLRARSGSFVRVHLDDRKTYDVPLRRRKDLDAALGEVRALLPHATEGYSLQVFDTYRRSPDDLRRERST